MAGLIPAPPKCPPHWPPAERVTWRSGWKAGYAQALKDMEEAEKDGDSSAQALPEAMIATYTCGWTSCTDPRHLRWVPKPSNWVDEP